MTTLDAPVLEARDLRKSFGALVATNGLSLTVRRGEIHALIGPNGAGKSTAIAQLAGSLQPDEGEVLFSGQPVTRLDEAGRARLGLARSFQISALFPEMTALESVMLAVQAGRAIMPGSGSPSVPTKACWSQRARLSTRSASGIWRARGHPIWRTGSGDFWKWPWRWPANRRCCCWMNPWRGWVSSKRATFPP